MTSEIITFRPLNENTVAFLRLRKWCFDNGFSFSDVMNAILEPLVYHLENASQKIAGTDMVNVNLCPGTITLTPSRRHRTPTKAEREYFAVMGQQITIAERNGHRLPDELSALI